MAAPITLAAADDDLRAMLGHALASALVAKEMRPDFPNALPGTQKLRLIMLRLQEAALLAEEL